MATIIVVMIVAILIAMLVYSPVYIYRVLAWQESDAFDWQKFPSHPLTAAPTPYSFPVALDPQVAQRFGQLAGVADWHEFLAQNHTQAFIVLKDGVVVEESYFNNTQRDSMVTSFSMAKSVTSALIGIAIDEGFIQSVDAPITTYLPELIERDPRFAQITIRHLLLMSSGFDYQSFRPLLFNSDDPLTTYYPDQRKLALENTRILAAPGQKFSYNKYHPQLLGIILERSTGMSVTAYLQSRIWDRIGAEFDGSWSTDSEASDFEKMETGVNGRAIDFAKFGFLFLNRGNWQGEQLISEAWVRESTEPYFPDNAGTYYTEWFKLLPGRAYYRYMWWGYERGEGIYDFAAAGDKGQYIYVSPSNGIVIVRHGTDYGIPSQEWLTLFHEFAGHY
jgi:CubicO group peptidase (beta-lactamase class C family)